MKKRPKILVVGSLMMNQGIETSVIPEEGQTVMGEDIKKSPGGKGANQAVRTNIAGEFQKSNLAAALQTAELICGRLDEDKIYEALSQIRISGRMEEIAPGIIVDVSHNIQGMQGFVQTVEANYHGMKKRILFAASHQNEEEYMKNILKTIPEIEAFYTVGIHKRRINEAEFQDAFRKMIDRNQETTVCFVVGSFYLAGMAKEFINQEEENVRL